MGKTECNCEICREGKGLVLPEMKVSDLPFKARRIIEEVNRNYEETGNVPDQDRIRATNALMEAGLLPQDTDPMKVVIQVANAKAPPELKGKFRVITQEAYDKSTQNYEAAMLARQMMMEMMLGRMMAEGGHEPEALH